MAVIKIAPHICSLLALFKITSQSASVIFIATNCWWIASNWSSKHHIVLIVSWCLLSRGCGLQALDSSFFFIYSKFSSVCCMFSLLLPHFHLLFHHHLFLSAVFVWKGKSKRMNFCCYDMWTRSSELCWLHTRSGEKQIADLFLPLRGTRRLGAFKLNLYF